ncbi:hypothetical protein AAG906_002206 [Vitis piasezkii]
MKDEMKSMKDNGVWDLVELLEGVKSIGCKWIFKTKRDSKGNIVRYKARLVAKEFIACYEASNHGIWLRNFITQLRIVDGIEKPLRINCDNKVAELYSKNNRSSSKSKHIDIKFLVVKERVQSLQVSIEHISTNSMIADPLTKGLPPKVYHEHVTHMGVVHIDDVLI